MFATRNAAALRAECPAQTMTKPSKSRARARTAARMGGGASPSGGGDPAPERSAASGLSGSGGQRFGPDDGGSRHIEIRLWLRLLACSTRIENVLKSRLRRDFGTSLARFEVLAQLDRFAHGLSMTELSRRLLVSNGAVTGLVEKLVAEALVCREEHARDKRTVIVHLTPEGRAQFRKMALRHEEWVISLLGDLSHAARVELLHNLTLLKRRLDAAAGKSGRIDTPSRDMALADEQAD
jgi:DNA-binding MarR family transcriptional regulator